MTRCHTWNNFHQRLRKRQQSILKRWQRHLSTRLLCVATFDVFQMRCSRESPGKTLRGHGATFQIPCLKSLTSFGMLALQHHHFTPSEAKAVSSKIAQNSKSI